MRIVFAGTPEFAVPSLRSLFGSEHTVSGVITRADAPLGRKRVLTPSPVAIAAEELGLPTFKSNRLDTAADAWVDGLQPDLGVIVAYGGLVRDPLLTLPTLGWINLHFSDLPRYRGAAPVQRALMDGEQTLGVTVFRLVEALDAGDVLTRDQMSFAEGTSSGDALTQLSQFGTSALLKAIEMLQRDPLAGLPQTGPSTYAHKLTRGDGKLDLSRPVSEVLAHWSGVTPEPGAFVMHDDEAIKLLEVAPAGLGDADEIGVASIAGTQALLQVPGGSLELVRVQPAGKAPMDGTAWLRGRGGKVVLR